MATCLIVAVCCSSLTTVAARASTGGNERPVFAASVNKDNSAILLVGRLGGSAQRIYKSPVFGGIPAVAVSRSGSQVAFVYTVGNSGDQLAVINTDGSGFRQLTHATHGAFEHPVWSADDRTIYFGRIFTPKDPTRSNFPRLWQVPADGSNQPTLVGGGSYAAPTSAQQAGHWLALRSVRPDSGYGRCAVIRTDGSSRRNVKDNCNDALWRPRTRQLATTRVTAAAYSGPTVQIWLLSLKSGGYHVIPNVQPASGGGRAYPLAWTGDGTRLYYDRWGPSGRLTVYRIRPDGSHKRDVTPAVPRNETDAFAVQPG